MARIGGETPLVEGIHTISLEAPAGTTSAAPILPGYIYKVDGTAAADGVSGAYKAVPCSSGDDPSTPVLLVTPLHRMTSVDVGGFILLSGNQSQVRRLKYKSGSAPTVGQSIEASSDLNTVVGKTYDGRSMVLFVDTNALEVEVLI